MNEFKNVCKIKGETSDVRAKSEKEWEGEISMMRFVTTNE